MHWCHGGSGWLMTGLELTVADKPDISNPCGRGAVRRIHWESEHPSCQWASQAQPRALSPASHTPTGPGGAREHLRPLKSNIVKKTVAFGQKVIKGLSALFGNEAPQSRLKHKVSLVSLGWQMKNEAGARRRQGHVKHCCPVEKCPGDIRQSICLFHPGNNPQY